MNLVKLINDIRNLDVHAYDLVVNDFEPVSAWACKIKNKPCISLSHQCAVLHPNAPKPATSDWRGKLVLERYAPTTAAYGFHFKAFADNIHTPVIRREIRALTTTNEGHYTVYLPAYDDKTMVQHLSQFSSVNWQVFSKHNKQPFAFKNVHVQPIENEAFIRSMASSAGVLCGAGFEGPAEALYLGKKLLAIPMRDQYEQQCNAAGLTDLGIPVIKSLDSRYYNDIQTWLSAGKVIPVNYPDETADIVAKLVAEHAPAYPNLANLV